MTPDVQFLTLLAVIALFFITELVPLAITAIGGALACGLLGFIPPKAVFAGLSNPTVVLFAGMFVVGAAMFHTGLAQLIGERVVLLFGTGEKSLMLGIMIVGAVLSGFLSNTGTTACLMPVVLGICAAARQPASRQLLPLAFGVAFGGIFTIIGTPPNLIASQTLTEAGFQPFGFFEFAWVGIPIAIAGMLYMMLIGHHLLPKVQVDPNMEIEQEFEISTTDPQKQIISGLILLGVVLVMALNLSFITLEMAAIIGALIAVLTGCLTEKQAYASIDWVTIFLFAGMLSVSSAMDKTGAGKLLAKFCVDLLGGMPSPLFVTALLFLVSCVLTQFMSNTATATLICPIGLAIAAQIGASPHAVLMSITIGIACAYATPVGTPPNTLVLGPGGYHFMDYVKVGTPLILVSFIVSMIIIPIVWPFFK